MSDLVMSLLALLLLAIGGGAVRLARRLA